MMNSCCIGSAREMVFLKVRCPSIMSKESIVNENLLDSYKMLKFVNYHAKKHSFKNKVEFFWMFS